MLYPAVVTREGKHTLAEFPDCPGCQTFAGRGEDIDAMAEEALWGWLEVGIEEDQTPPRPSRHVAAPPGGEIHWISVPPNIAAAMSIRWARQDAGLTQAELAARVGVSQQAIARLERLRGNARLKTLARAAAALDRRLVVDITLVPAPRGARPSKSRKARPGPRRSRSRGRSRR